MNINISLSKYGDELTINVSVPTDVEYADVTIDKIAINDNSKYTVEYPASPQIEISGSASGDFVLTNNKSYSKTFQIQTLIGNGLSAIQFPEHWYTTDEEIKFYPQDKINQIVNKLHGRIN